MESDEHLLLPSAGSRRDAGAGAGVRARHRDRGARHREGVGRGGRRRNSARWSAASRSSSTPACASSPRSARCARSPSCGTRSPRERYGVTDPKQRLFRYGVQVNSLGLTEPQPENNVARILIEMLAVTLSKNARARAVQLPAWNEALGLPRPWDQQWSLRMQQILAYETDLLEYGDMFDGSRGDRRARSTSSSARPRDELAAHRRAGRRRRGGRDRLHEAAARRVRTRSASRRSSAASRSWSASTASSRPSRRRSSGRRRRDPDGAARGRGRADRAAQGLARCARRRRPSRPRSRTCARRRATAATSCRPRSPARRPASPPANGAGAARGFGEYRAPTGVGRAMRNDVRRPRRPARRRRPRVEKLGRRMKFLVGKPGLDGHSNGAEQIAVRARDAGMEVVYEGIRLTPAEIVDAAREQKAHVVGLSILSGSHLPLVKDVVDAHEGGRPRRRAGRGRRHHPAGGRRSAEAGRRRRRLHAEGFRAQPHHDGSGRIVERAPTRRCSRRLRLRVATSSAPEMRSKDRRTRMARWGRMLEFTPPRDRSRTSRATDCIDPCGSSRKRTSLLPRPSAAAMSPS